MIIAYLKQTEAHVIACSGPVIAAAWAAEVKNVSAALAVTGGNAYMIHIEVHAWSASTQSQRMSICLPTKKPQSTMHPEVVWQTWLTCYVAGNLLQRANVTQEPVLLV